MRQRMLTFVSSGTTRYATVTPQATLLPYNLLAQRLEDSRRRKLEHCCQSAVCVCLSSMRANSHLTTTFPQSPSTVACGLLTLTNDTRTGVNRKTLLYMFRERTSCWFEQLSTFFGMLSEKMLFTVCGFYMFWEFSTCSLYVDAHSFKFLPPAPPHAHVI
jgi:hypothetical protein